MMGARYKLSADARVLYTWHDETKQWVPIFRASRPQADGESMQHWIDTAHVWLTQTPMEANRS